MIKFLSKMFIKDYTNYKDPHVRQNYGVLCGSVGIFFNILLFTFKLIFGTITASVAIVADAFNNLSDAASSCVQILGFKLSGKKPDPEHPFGHGRIEYVAALGISFLILLMGVELVKSSIKSLIHPEPVTFSITAIVVLVVSILVKAYMYLYNHKVGKKIDSVAMEATAKDSLGDTITTFLVIVSLVASKFTSFPVDGVAGIIVGLFILKTGFESAKETVNLLIGVAATKDLAEEIEKELLKFHDIICMHDLVVHDYGPGRMMISLHAEVPGDKNIFDLHEEIDLAEYTLSQKFNCQTIIHMDPIDLNNKDLDEFRQIIKEETQKISPNMSFHDVRIVPGTNNSNLIFDVVKPFDCQLSDDELKKTLFTNIRARAKIPVMCVITIDQPYYEE